MPALLVGVGELPGVDVAVADGDGDASADGDADVDGDADEDGGCPWDAELPGA